MISLFLLKRKLIFMWQFVTLILRSKLLVTPIKIDWFIIWQETKFSFQLGSSPVKKWTDFNMWLKSIWYIQNVNLVNLVLMLLVEKLRDFLNVIRINLIFTKIIKNKWIFFFSVVSKKISPICNVEMKRVKWGSLNK